jgi:Putative transposase of IS4/5 family (DUF4096)
MAKELVSDELWEIVEPLLPEKPPKPKGGRPRLDDRAALSGILFVLKSGIPWNASPRDGLRKRGNLLAPPEGMARGWGVGAPSLGSAGPSRRGRADRLGARFFGLGFHPGIKGPKDRSESDG